MPWLEQKRFRRAIKWQDGFKRRISTSIAALNYESVQDSGDYDTPVDMAPSRINNAQLNGWRNTSAGWHFAYQGFAPVQQQDLQGTLAFGGRRGQNWLKLRPHRIGYLHWPTKNFTAIGGAPTFSPPTLVADTKTVGFPNDPDPVATDINIGSTATISDLWTTPGAGSCDWEIKLFGGQLKQSFIVNNAAREWIAANAAPTTPAAETWFGVAMLVDFSDLPKWVLRDIEVNRNSGDYEFTNDLVFKDATDKALAYLDTGEIFVKERGGRVTIRKRLYKQGNQWWYLIGANVAEINQNLLPGDLVIDPAISEEDISQNSDDALEENDGTMQLSGVYSREYLGYNNRWAGWRFQSIPVAQGATIDSATLEPRRTAYASASSVTADLHCEDADNAGTFTSTSGDISGRTRTTAKKALTSADWPNNNQRGSWDVAAPIEEVVGRAGWAYNNALVFIGDTTYGAYGTRIGFDDYSGGANFAADLNITYTAAAGDVSANPSGAEAAGEAGTVSVTGDVNYTLTGAEAAGEAGAVTVQAGASQTLTGAEAAGEAGTVTATTDVNQAVTGAEAAGQAGTADAVTPDATATITGAEAAGDAGTVTATTDVNQTLTGAEGPGQAGTVTVTGDVNQTLTGAEAAGEAGTVKAVSQFGRISPLILPVRHYGSFIKSVSGDATANLAGAEAAGEAGTVSVTTDVNVSITGAEAAGEAGTVIAGAVAVANITGAEAAGEAGTVSVTTDVNQTLTGAEAAGQAGTVAVTGVASGRRLTPLILPALETSFSKGDGTVTVFLTGAEAVGEAETLEGSSVTIYLDGAEAVGQAGLVQSGSDQAPADRTVTVAADDNTIIVTADIDSLLVDEDSNSLQVAAETNTLMVEA